MKKAVCSLIAIVLILVLNGCGSYSRLNEEGLYREKVDTFFSALDNGDAATIKSLFSQTVLDNDADLDDQIKRLIAEYPGQTTKIAFDGCFAGEYEREEGRYRSSVYASFPVVGNGKYWWVFIELIYEDDFLPDNIGLNRVFFYTADEYCNDFHNDVERSSDIGLSVFADLKLEKEVRCINGLPYEFTQTEQNVTVSEAEEFLSLNRSFDDFATNFGLPNCKDTLGRYYYEIKDNNGETVYLELATRDGEIIYANIVGEFEYVRSVLEEKTN